VWNDTARAVLDSVLEVDEIASALISERIERTTAKHTVEKITAHFVAWEILTIFVFKIFTAVFHHKFSYALVTVFIIAQNFKNSITLNINYLKFGSYNISNVVYNNNRVDKTQLI
jgi:DNA integrity scanning protein DisA with diadenylate cyclase activity